MKLLGTCCIILFTLIPATSLGQQTPPRPNILIYMADDMGIGDTSAYQDWTGNADAVQVKTPSMERLARTGVRFTDAHTPSSRCTATRYGLLTGRYSWRTSLKYSVLWGPQGDPLIQRDRPTLATMLKAVQYRTGMVGKWHVGLTYRDSSGKPAKSYQDADLRQGIADGPLNHGFDFFHGTSRSHPTSAPQGWLFGDRVAAATGPKTVNGKRFVLAETGSTNFDMAKRFMATHLASPQAKSWPFFLYYAAHSNHTRHTPASSIGGKPVAGQSHPGGKRSDFIYENDVALGLLIEYLSQTQDPRRPSHSLLDNTLIIFTSDNGAENKSKSATGPLRSNKGSVYEGGHRVPFLVSWPAGGIGDGDEETEGQSCDMPIGLIDIYASLATIAGVSDAAGGDDSFDISPVWQSPGLIKRPPLVHHDHKEGGNGGARDQRAAWLAIRIDDPRIDGKRVTGQWKLMVDEGLLLRGEMKPVELYNLAKDPREKENLISHPNYGHLVKYMAAQLKAIHDR